MPSYVNILNKVLSVGTIVLQVLVVLLILNLIFSKSSRNKLSIFFKDNIFAFGFLVGLGAIVISLFYSEVIGYAPCELCWVQRIFLYPQAILFGLGLYKKDKSILDYSLIFAVLGSLTSIYHIYVENGGTTSIACATPGSGQVSCAIRYVYEFGYITIPVMCLTLSLFVIVLIWNYKHISKLKKLN